MSANRYYTLEGYDPTDGLTGGRWMRDTWGVVRWVETTVGKVCEDCRHRSVGTKTNVCNACRKKRNRAVASQTRSAAGLLACVCGAGVDETCKTSGGNPTSPHAARILNRRCPCGNTPSSTGRHNRYCDNCREKAKAETYRRREIRKPTSQRRAA